jgi:hypothetical protein
MLVAQHVAQHVALVVQHGAQLVANGGVKLRFVRHLFLFLLCYKGWKENQKFGSHKQLS